MASPEGYPETDLSASSLLSRQSQKISVELWRSKQERKGGIPKRECYKDSWSSIPLAYSDSVEHISYPNGEARKQGYLSTNFCPSLFEDSFWKH